MAPAAGARAAHAPADHGVAGGAEVPRVERVEVEAAVARQLIGP